MPLTLLSGAPAIGMVGAVAAAGWAGQDCLLLAGCTVLGHRLFLVRMDRGAPLRALTATVAEREGVAVAACAFVFFVGLAMFWAGWHLASVTASPLLHAGSETR